MFWNMFWSWGSMNVVSSDLQYKMASRIHLSELGIVTRPGWLAPTSACTCICCKTLIVARSWLLPLKFPQTLCLGVVFKTCQKHELGQKLCFLRTQLQFETAQALCSSVALRLNVGSQFQHWILSKENYTESIRAWWSQTGHFSNIRLLFFKVCHPSKFQ